jgi:hypothetical protein
MGAIAEAIVANMQPLLDQTDGSQEQLNKAAAIGQLCYNFALLPEDSRETMLDEVRPSLKMNDEEFDVFRRSVIAPMIQRHEQMLPGMRRWGSTDLTPSPPPVPAPARKARPGEKYPGTDRCARCPCGSGEKYKFCCGARGR